MLDEPTTGVDPLSRRQFWELIQRIRDERPQMSVVVATAYMEEADRFDWLVAMDAGRVLATGTPADLRARTGAASLEAAFIALLPEEKRREHRPVDIPPRDASVDGEIAIEARGLTMRFGDFTVVEDVSFRIERGEIFGFLGSNGCGKTTTMKMLTGLLPASEGQAWLFGQPVDSYGIGIRRRVGYMSQGFSLYTELTVRQNLELHARLFDVPAGEIPSRVGEMTSRFGLADVVDLLPEKLPLGQRQRLSLAVAMIHRPEMLILDEPTSGVDPVARDNFWRILVELARRGKVPAVIPLLGFDCALSRRRAFPSLRYHVDGYFLWHHRALHAPVRASHHPCPGAARNAFRRHDAARKHAGCRALPHARRADHAFRDDGAGHSLLRCGFLGRLAAIPGTGADRLGALHLCARPLPLHHLKNGVSAVPKSASQDKTPPPDDPETAHIVRL